MPNYQELKESLEERIAELEVRAQLLEGAKSAQTPISQIAFKKINRKTDELLPDEIALILEAKHKNRAQKGVDYEPILLKDEKDLAIFNNILADLPKGQNFLSRCLLRISRQNKNF